MVGPGLSELKNGLRLIRKQPLVAATVILALTVGIGMATTGFTFMNAVLYGELPFENGDRFVRLTARTEPEGMTATLETDRFRLLREEAAALAYLGAIGTGRYNVLYESGAAADAIESVNGASVTPGWFRSLPYRPLIGRLLIPEDGRPGATPVALIRQSFWERRFDADPAAIGRDLNIAGVVHTIVGVLPDTCKFPNSGELWLPLDTEHLGGSSLAAGVRVGFGGVLAAGVPLDAALSQLDQLSRQFEATRPEVDPLRLELRRFTDLSMTRIDTPLMVGTAVMVMVLLLVAANVANLILARNANRTAELAVRSALGASRARVVGQLFCEVLLLGLVAAALGLLASQVTFDIVARSFETDELPFWISFAPSLPTALFVVAVTLLASAVAGAWPAWKATRRDPARAVAADGPRTTTVGIGRFGSAMIVTETALSVALLSGAVVLAWGFARYADQSVDLPRGEILTAQLYVDPGDDEGAAVAELQDAILAAVERIPGVAAYGAASSLPRMSPRGEPLQLESSPGEPATAPVNVPAVGVRPGFFAALGGEIVAGRSFHEPDYTADAPPVAVVNQPFVDTLLGGRNPIGRRIRVVRPDGGNGTGVEAEQWREIVGVVPDLGLLVGDAERAAGYYVPMRSRSLFYLALRAQGDPTQLAAPLRKALFEVDPRIIVTRVVPLEAVAEEDRSAFLVMSSVLTAIGGAALALSLVGMYAIMSFAVTRRTREIGIRVALGASHGRILQSVVGGAAILLGLGAIIGGVLAAGLTALMDKALVSQLPDPGAWVFPGVALLLALAGLVASWVPARRALRIRPTEALRQL